MSIKTIKSFFHSNEPERTILSKKLNNQKNSKTNFWNNIFSKISESFSSQPPSQKKLIVVKRIPNKTDKKIEKSWKKSLLLITGGIIAGLAICVSLGYCIGYLNNESDISKFENLYNPNKVCWYILKDKYSPLDTNNEEENKNFSNFFGYQYQGTVTRDDSFDIKTRDQGKTIRFFNYNENNDNCRWKIWITNQALFKNVPKAILSPENFDPIKSWFYDVFSDNHGDRCFTVE